MYKTVNILEASKNKNEVPFSSITKKHFNDRLQFKQVKSTQSKWSNNTHTKTHPEIQIYKELIIYKIKSFIMHSPTTDTYPVKIQN